MRKLLWLGLAGFVVAGVTMSGCALPYYMQAVGGQVHLLRQRVPIEEVVADDAVDGATRELLQVVTSIRRFAVEELGLPDNRSYTSFVDLGRDYVVWNVVAAEEFSVDPLGWCFPVAGCVTYRGYFREAKAEKFAGRLREDGYDIFTGGSAAYSTLGYFADPVLNTMLNRGEVEIAALLFHELAHQQVYVKGDTELSESFATAVEQFGVERWLTSHDRPEALAEYRARLARQQEFADLVARQRERLRVLYSEDLDEASMRQQKAGAFDVMRAEYQQLREQWGGRGWYDAWFEGEINNAKIASVSSYQRWVPGLRSELERQGPAAFFAAVESLAEQDEEERLQVLQAWNEASVVPALADRRQFVDVAVQIARDDRLHAFRLDAECCESIVAADAGNGQ